MKIKYFILCELSQRELLFNILIAEEIFKKTGEKVAIIWQDSFFSKFLIKDSFVFVKDFANWNTNRFINLKKRKNHITAFDQEGLIIRNPEFYCDQRVSEKSLDLVDKVLLWGKNQRDILTKKYVKYSKKFELFGFPLFDEYAKQRIKKNKNKEITNILINSRLTRANVSLSEQTEQLRDLGLIASKKDYNDLRDIINFENSLQNFLIKLAIELSFNYNVVFRPHPSENRKTYSQKFRGSNVTISNKLSVLEDLMFTDFLIAENCTTMLEANQLGIPVLSIGLNKKKRPFTSFFEDKFPCAKNIKQVMDFLAKLSSNYNLTLDLDYYIEKFRPEALFNYLNSNQKEGCYYLMVIDYFDEFLKKTIAFVPNYMLPQRLKRVKQGYVMKCRKFGNAYELANLANVTMKLLGKRGLVHYNSPTCIIFEKKE